MLRWSQGAVAVAFASTAVLHIVGAGSVDPVAQTISDYVAIPGGYALLGVAAFTLTAAGAVLAVGVCRVGLPRPGTPAALLWSWSVALLLLGVFPTNAPGTPPGLVAAVHRYAGAWAFAVLPVAGMLVARRLRDTPGWTRAATGLARLSVTTAVLSLTFLLAHIPLVFGGTSPVPLLGLVERALYAVLLVLLLAIAQVVDQPVVSGSTVIRKASEVGSAA